MNSAGSLPVKAKRHMFVVFCPRTYGLRAPCSNEILQVYLKAHHCRGHNSEVAVLNTRKLPRHAVTTAPGRPFWQPPGMRCFTFDGPEGFILKYCLRLGQNLQSAFFHDIQDILFIIYICII